MKKTGPPRTAARVRPLPRRQWEWLTGAVAVWPLAVLLGGEAAAVTEAAPMETAAPTPSPEADAESALPLRGRVGAPLAAPNNLLVSAMDDLSASADAPEPLALATPPLPRRNPQASRAWPPLSTPEPDTPQLAAPLWPRSRIQEQAETAAQDTDSPPAQPISNPSRDRPRAWPAIADSAFDAAPLRTAAEVQAAPLDPWIAGSTRMASAQPVTETAAVAATLPSEAVVANAPPEDIEIILADPAPEVLEPEAPAPRRSRAWPAIPEPTPDLTAFVPVQLPDGTLAETLASAVQDALEQNPEIQIAEAQWEDARYGVQESRAALLPSMEVQAARGHERTVPESGDQSDHSRSELSLSVRQNVYDFGATRGSVRSADRVADSAEWAFRAQVDTVALEIAEAFLQVLEQQSIVTLAEQNLAAHERILETVRTQQEFGLVTGADVSRVDARLNAARADLLDQRSALEQARENYRRLLNREPGPLAEPARVEGLIPPTADEAVALLDERNPQVLQARLLLASLEEQRDSTRAGYLPRFDLELTASARDNAGGPTGRNDESRAMINMRMPLFDGGAREAAIGRVGARIRQAEFEVERAERDAEQAVRNDYSALSSAWEKVDAIEDEVAAAQRLVELYDEQFRQGSRSVFDLLDGQSTLYQAEVRRESNRTEMRISAYRVLRTLGSLFDTITMPPAEIPQLNRPTPAPRPASAAAAAAAGETDAAAEATPIAAMAPPPPNGADVEDETIILLPAADEAIPGRRRPSAD